MLEEWVWDDTPRMNFHGSLATCANVWNTTGVPHKLISTVADLFDDEASKRVSQRPGRCMRGPEPQLGLTDL